jgi:hypothetical protein
MGDLNYRLREVSVDKALTCLAKCARRLDDACRLCNSARSRARAAYACTEANWTSSASATSCGRRSLLAAPSRPSEVRARCSRPHARMHACTHAHNTWIHRTEARAGLLADVQEARGPQASNGQGRRLVHRRAKCAAPSAMRSHLGSLAHAPSRTRRVNAVYRVQYREPWYKSGKLKPRVPAFCDRVLLHSMPDLASSRPAGRRSDIRSIDCLTSRAGWQAGG